ncbi:MAG: polysaccharide export protein [Acidobacteriota bacterium]|nr:MAG: polysaccharide export protein [Acidobacteriota bacterium]
MKNDIRFCMAVFSVLLLFSTASAQAPPSDLDKVKPAKKEAGRDESSPQRREDVSEAEAVVLPYINNFFTSVRIGPEDVITVDVFDLPNYSRSNITVPPNGRINYPLIGQVLVAGRTTGEVEKEITEKLLEYVIEPKVSVQLVQVHSLKFMVIGDVANPGIYEMTRRMTVTEALARAGYVTRFADRKNVAILRLQPGGETLPLKVNMKEIEKGKTQDVFLVPGDTIVVPGNTFKAIDQFLGIVSLGAWMRVIAR